MSESQLTKKALAAALKELVATTSLAKITVADIVTQCGLQRQTFYYHFRDKYELVNWIYQTEALAEISDCKDYQNWPEGFRRIFTYLAANRVFYIDALKTQYPSTFADYLYAVTRELILNVLKEVAGRLHAHVRDDNQNFIADFYAFACVGITVRWIKEGMQETPADLTERITDVLTGSMERALATNVRLQGFGT